MTSGKLLKISETRSVYILENEESTYISKTGVIKYRNLGKDWDMRIIHERYCAVSGSMLSILKLDGNDDFHFPIEWLDTTKGMINILIENGVLK